MRPNQQTWKLFQLFAHQNHTNSIALSPKPLKFPFSSASLPSLESPHRPDRLIGRENPKLPKQNDDDFVIPSLADWIHNHNLANSNPVANRLSFEPAISDFDKLTQILKKHHSSTESVIEALNGCGIEATNDLILQLLKRFSNDWVSAFGVFTWAKNQTGYVHTPESYYLMIYILGKRKKFNLMWDLVEEAKLKGYVSSVIMGTVMKKLAAARKYEDAIEAFRGLEKFGVSKDIVTLNALMDALARGGSVEHAYNVFIEFKDCIPVNYQSFSILIHGYCKARKLYDAKKTMVEMEKHGFQPDVIVYTSFILAYCNSNDFRNVDATLKEMEERGCKPNVITYTIIMHSFGKAERINEALEVYVKMKRNGLVPDCAFYSSMIFLLSNSGRIKDAWSAFEDMEKQGVTRDLMTYNVMIKCACTHMQEENALKLLRKMQEEQYKPNVDTYAPLLKLCCKKKRIKVLRFLLDHMYKINNVRVDLSIYDLLVSGLCNSGKIELACSFFEEATSKGMIPFDRTYKNLVNALEKNNMTETVLKIQKLMLMVQRIQQNTINA